MNCCPDRCDIEFEYDWKYTNMCMNYLVDNPPYFLNANDKLNLSLKEDAFDHVYLVSEKGKIELTKENLTWSGTVPSSWTQTGSFQVIVERSGRKTLLYQGMLNNERLSGNTSASTGSLHQDFELVVTPDDIDSEASDNQWDVFKAGSDIEAKVKDMFDWIDSNRSSVINIQCYAEYEINNMTNSYKDFGTYASVNGGELTEQAMSVDADTIIRYDILSVQCSGFTTMALSTNDTNGSVVLTWQIMKAIEESKEEKNTIYAIANPFVRALLKSREELADNEDYKLKLKIRLFYIED